MTDIAEFGGGNGGLTEVGMNIPDGASRDDLMQLGHNLKRLEKGTQWAIGDWFNALDKGYGDGSAQAACEEVGLNYGTARTYARVAKAYEYGLRLRALSFAHHKKVAPLPVEQREELLKRAAIGVPDVKGGKPEVDPRTGIAKTRPMSCSEMMHEKKVMLGEFVQDEQVIDGAICDAKTFRDGLKTKRQQKEFDAIFETMKAEFWRQVDEQAALKVEAEKKAIKEKLEKIIEGEENDI